MNTLIIIGLGFSSISILWCLNNKFNVSLAGPVCFFALVNVASVIGGFLYYGIQTDGASIALNESIKVFDEVAIDSILMVMLFLLGSLIFFYKAEKIEGGGGSKQKIIDLFDKVSVAHTYIFVVFGVLLFILGNGPFELFFRYGYMSESNKFAKIAGTFIVLISSFLIGVKSIKIGEGVSFLIILLLIFIEMAYSSRMAALSIVIYTGGLFLYKNNNFSKIMAFVSIVAAPFLIHSALFMRGEYKQGLLPFINIISTDSYFWSSYDILTVLNNTLLVNFVITSLTVTTAHINVAYILTTFNPMPGIMTDWYNLERGLNEATPYSSMGELLNFNIYFSSFFYLLLGVLFSYVEQKGKGGNILFFTVGFATMNLVSITMLQYNLRSSLRLMLYFFIVAFLLKFLFLIVNRKLS